MSKAISVKLSLLEQFSRSFHQMEGICVNFLDQVQFFRFLEGRCHGNQLKLKNWLFYFVALPFGKGLQYRNSDFKRLDRMNIYLHRVQFW